MAPTSCGFTTSAPHLDVVTLAPGCPLPAEERAAQPQGCKEPKGGGCSWTGVGGPAQSDIRPSGMGDKREGWGLRGRTPELWMHHPNSGPRFSSKVSTDPGPQLCPCASHTPAPATLSGSPPQLAFPSLGSIPAGPTETNSHGGLCLRALLSSGDTVRATRVTGKSLRVVLQRSKESEMTDNNSFHATNTACIPNILSTGDR